MSTLAAACLTTAGCWFFFFTVPARRTGENLDAQFGRFVRDVAVRPWHNAVAVAKDSQRWAWGGAWSEPDADAARKAALLNCVSQRARQSVEAPCQGLLGRWADHGIGRGVRCECRLEILSLRISALSAPTLIACRRFPLSWRTTSLSRPPRTLSESGET